MNLKVNDYIIIVLIAVLLFLDHFVSGIPHNLLAWVFAGVIIYSLNYKKYKDVSLKEIMNWQILSSIVVLVLVLIFTLIGTDDTPGVSLTSGMFYFVILLSLFEIIYQRLQIKRGTDDR
ncbi:hypothetical protein E3U55_16110 [Filobacillus milosensis]|uniref:Uncharacterized protein n=1 Tax=Filobacillus milosensis TaxID=94137 RepID=A0A4Y8IBM1_9BACI|nr:hypothetical protein [Filobacillus milosensis]TFB13367.1 hypothetical protein E3U55_16110 [Filobacillus milosensis]